MFLGCLAAAGGGVLLSLDSASAEPVAGVAVGDGFLVAAALLWSIQTVMPSLKASESRSFTVYGKTWGEPSRSASSSTSSTVLD